MSGTAIRKVTENIWTFSRPFGSGLPVGGRSTAIQLRDGGLWVFASTALNEETKTKIDELGEVKYIVSADGMHWLFLREFKEAYPSAKVVGVELLLTKENCIKPDGVYGRDPPETKYGYEDEIGACYFPGFRNKDVAFYHYQSKTLIVADLLFNLPAKEQYSMQAQKPFLLRLNVGPNNWLHQKILGFLATDKEAMKRDAKTVASWDIEKIIPCHGEVIESNGNEAWRAAYKTFLQ